MSTKALVSLGVAAAVALAGVSAEAANTSSSFTTQITITSSCTILGTAALNFGNQGVIGINVPATSTLQVQCTNSTPYNIGLDAGTGLGATPPARIMTAGLATVVYSIYSDSAHTTVWGNTVGTNTVSAVGNGASQSYTLYGLVPVQVTPVAGTYTDTITVNVTY